MSAACQPFESGRYGVYSFVAEDPELLDTTRFEELITIADFRFARPNPTTECKLAGKRPGRRTKQGLIVEEPQKRWAIECQLELEAGEVDRVVLSMKSRGRLGFVLSWSGPQESPDSNQARVLRVSPRDAVPTPQGIDYVFEVGNNRAWRGSIESLNFRAHVSPSDHPLTVSGITLTKRVPEPEKFAELLSRPWKIDLSGEARNALLAPPGLRLSRFVSAGGDPRLELSYGLPIGATAAVTFRASVARRLRPSKVIFEKTVEPGSPDAGSWQDVQLSLEELTGRDFEIELETISEEFETDPTFQLPLWGNPEVVSCEETVGSRPNVVLISIDTLRADRLSLYSYSRKTSPNLDRWAQQFGATFRHTVAAAPWTLPSHVSMFSGRDALSHRVNYPTSAPRDLVTLTDVLDEEGYATVAITDGGYLHPRFGLIQGFDRYRHEYSAGRRDRMAAAVDETIHWLEDQQSCRRPFFLFFHTYEVHEPYLVRQPYLEELTGLDEEVTGITVGTTPRPRSERSAVRSRVFDIRKHGAPLEGLSEEEGFALASDIYDSGIAYMDVQLNRLFQSLQELGLDRNTIVVVTSDHGEALGEHQLAGHADLYDPTLRIPLVIAAPGLTENRGIVEQPVGTVDIFPTVLQLLRIPHGEVDGHSLVALLRGEDAEHPPLIQSYEALNQRGLALRENGLKYIFADAPWPLIRREEAFDLAADPLELRPLALSDQRLRNLRETAASLLRTRHRGLVVEVSNHSSAGMRGTLSGNWNPSRIKSPNADISLSTVKGGGVTLELLPGREVTLLISDLEDLEARLELTLEGTESPCRFTSPVQELAGQPAVLSVTPEACERVASADVATSQLLTTVSYQGAMPVDAGEASMVVDESLRKRLEALGYLD